MGGECATYVGEDKLIQSHGVGKLKKREHKGTREDNTKWKLEK
jgi:hypothetical protein